MTAALETVLRTFLKTPLGAASLAFLRVTLAAIVAAWVNAGLPMSDLTGGQVEGFIRVGLTAGIALVTANAVGPWEKRYGLYMAQKG